MVTDEQVCAFYPLVDYLAQRYDGYNQAEYDDLYQEGMIQVLAALTSGKQPSQNIIAKVMLRWVGKCRARGLTAHKWTEESDPYVSHEGG